MVTLSLDQQCTLVLLDPPGIKPLALQEINLRHLNGIRKHQLSYIYDSCLSIFCMVRNYCLS